VSTKDTLFFHIQLKLFLCYVADTGFDGHNLQPLRYFQFFKVPSRAQEAYWWQWRVIIYSFLSDVFNHTSRQIVFWNHLRIIVSDTKRG